LEFVMNKDLPGETPSPGDDESAPDSFDGSPPPARRGRSLGLRRGAAVTTAVGGLVLGSAVGGFLITRATGPVTTVAAASTADATTSPSPGAHFRGGFGGPNSGLGVNLVQDAATTIGISEQTLETDLQSGQTVAQVATAKGTTAQAVINALVGDETTAIDNLASSGKITSAQETKLKSNVTQMVTNFVNQTRPATAPGAGSGGSGEQAAVQAAATTIGVTVSTLEADLAKGESIASVAAAQSPSVSTSAVVSAVTAAVDSQISSLQTSGKITSAQASTLTSEVSSRMTDWVNDTYPGWPFGPFGTFTGFGGSFPDGSWGHGTGASPSASPSAT
jgi:hypothetical protein